MSDHHRILEQCRRLDSEDNIGASISLLTDSISHSPAHILYYERGWRYEEVSENDLALRDYTCAIDIEPHSRYLLARGLLLTSRLSDHESALSDFQQARIIAPQDPMVYLNLTECNLSLGKRAAAIENARMAVKLAPTNGFCHACLGQSLLAGDLPYDAAAELRIAISLDPSSVDSWGMLSRALEEAGDFSEARKCIERVIERDRSASYLIGYASLLLKLKEPRTAITVLQEARGLCLTEAQWYLVEGYLEIGNRLLDTQ
jgi:tetratricopeptide (TPR) repeat protein